MNLVEIKQEVIYSDSQSRLYEVSIDLTEEVSHLHLELVKAKDIVAKTEIKGKISVLCALQDIIQNRLKDPKLFLKESGERKELLSNRQFRIVAEMVLYRETYNRIVELASMNYHEIKLLKTELKANKLE